LAVPCCSLAVPWLLAPSQVVTWLLLSYSLVAAWLFLVAAGCCWHVGCLLVAAYFLLACILACLHGCMLGCRLVLAFCLLLM